MQNDSSVPLVAENQLKVIRNIGFGSFSTVCLGLHTAANDGTKSKVAVKYVKPEVVCNRADSQLFLKEVEILKNLQHRSIVKLLGVGPPIASDLPAESCSCCDEDAAEPKAVDACLNEGPFACYQPIESTATKEIPRDTKSVPSFLIQEYMPGGALNRVVAADMVRTPWERSSYTMADSMRWVINIAEALAYLHSQEPKIIHRDLKLSNILLTSTKCSEAEARVADFGLHTCLPQGRHHKPPQHQSPLTLRCSHAAACAANPLQQSPLKHPKHCCCKHEPGVQLVADSSDGSMDVAIKTDLQPPCSPAVQMGPLIEGVAIDKDVNSLCCCDVPTALPGVDEPLVQLLGPKHKHSSRTTDPGVFAAAQPDSLVAATAAVAADNEVCRSESAKVALLQQSATSRRLRFAANRSRSVPHLLALSMPSWHGYVRSPSHLSDTAQPGDAAGDNAMSASKTAMQMLHSMIAESCHDALTHRGVFGRSFRQQYRQLLRSQHTYPPTVKEQTVSTCSNSIQYIAVAATAGKAVSNADIVVVDESADTTSGSLEADVIQAVPGPGASICTTATCCDAGVHLLATNGDLTTAGVGVSSRYGDLRQSVNSVTSKLSGMTAGFRTRDNSFTSLTSLGELSATAAAHHATPTAAASVVSCEVVEDALFQLTPQTGSLVYMAPEVYRGEGYNEKADVYSFGIMLYELLHYQLLQLSIGAAGNDGQAALELYAASMAEEGYRPPISHKVPSVLQDLVRECWAQSPDDRPSMTVVLDKLMRIQKDLGLDPATAAQRGAGKSAGSWFSRCFGCM